MDEREPRQRRGRRLGAGTITVTAAVTGLLGLFLGGLPDMVLSGASYGLDYGFGVLGFIIGLVIVPAAEWGSRWGSHRRS